MSYRFPPVEGTVGKPPILPAYRLDVRQVSTGEFLAFVRRNPRYARSRMNPMLADTLYLASWRGDFAPPEGRLGEPVTEVSWFAAKAYCSEAGKRLPTTAEWERAASIVPPGLDSASYAGLILKWYSRPANQPASPGTSTGKSIRNALGIWDLHGKVWEWTADFNSMGPLSGRESRVGFFCGGAGGAAGDKADYAAFMRFSFRSSLKPAYAVSSLGFRCAR